MAAPSLRTVRAVFPHTALRLAVSSSGSSRGEEGRVRCERPSSRGGGVGTTTGWPPPSSDAVAQRRDHALPPDRAFRLGHRPGPLHRAVVCDIDGARLTRSAGHASTFLPPFPKAGFATRPSRSPRLNAAARCSTTKALTPDQLTHFGQVSPLTPLCLRNIPPSTTPWSLCRAVTLALAAGISAKASPYARRLATPSRRNRFVILQAVPSLPVALHPSSRTRSYLQLHVL